MNKKFTVETFNSMIQKVVEWNKLGGNHVEDKSLIPTYTQLSREEVFSQNELLQGWFSQDKILMGDGIADLVYTAGYLSELLECKIDESYLQQGGVLSVEGCLSNIAGSLINFDSFSKEMLKTDLYLLCKAMNKLMDVEAIFEVVSVSNYSKFLHENELYHGFCLDGEIQYIEDQGRYKGVDYHKEGAYYIFTAKEDLKNKVVFDKPKVVKHSKFKEVEDFSEFIY